MPGLAHLYIGEEAVAVGVCEALEQTDYITSTHRGHGHCLAKGASPDRMFAELLGKKAGYCKGKGGSMHIADPATGNLGANAIVCGSAGIATGAAFSARSLGNGRVAVCFFGEGALGQGVLYEEMNLAQLFKLPVIYVCENNLYTNTRITRKPRPEISSRGRLPSAWKPPAWMVRTCALSMASRSGWWIAPAAGMVLRSCSAILIATTDITSATSTANITAPSRKNKCGRRSAIRSRISGSGWSSRSSPMRQRLIACRLTLRLR